MVKEGVGVLEQRTVDEIQKDIDIAIAGERYEDAAKFRDERKEVEGKNKEAQ